MNAVGLAIIEDGNSANTRTLVDNSAGEVNRGFQEIRPTSFVSPPTPGWNLYIDDELIEIKDAGGPLVWEWIPGFYAGTVIADLVDPNGRIFSRYLLDVSPDPLKLGQQSFNVLIDEVREFNPALLFGSEPSGTTIGSELSDESKNIQCSRLLQFGPLLVTALPAIRARPHRTLSSIRALRPVEQVQRVDLQTARTALRNLPVLELLDSQGDTDIEGNAAQALLDVPYSRESFDSSANRCLAAILQSINRRAAQIKTHFAELVQKETGEDTRTPLSTRWPRRVLLIEDIERTVRHALNTEPLRSVTRPEISAAGLTAIAAHPLYARAQRIAWKILRPDYAGKAAEETSWMSPTWEIFERWCFVQLCKGLETLFPGLNWSLKGSQSSSIRFEGNGPTISISLHLQPTFNYRAEPATDTGFWSLSGQFIPDLVLIVDEGHVRRWFVLDAKYRHSRSSIVDAMKSAHIYHDALRRFDSPPERSLLLIPADSPAAHWLLSPAFHSKYGVGAVTFAPGTDAAQTFLQDLLRQ